MHVETIAVPYTDFGPTITTATNGCLTNLALHPPFTNCWVFTIHPEGILSSTLVLWYTRGGQLSPCSSHEPVPAVEVEDVITDPFVDFVVYRAITIFEGLIIATLIRSCKKKIGKSLSNCSTLLFENHCGSGIAVSFLFTYVCDHTFMKL